MNTMASSCSDLFISLFISDIVKEIESGKQCTVDLDAAKIYFQESPGNINTSEPDESKPENMQNDTIIEKSKADVKECTRDDTLQNFLKKQTSCLKRREGVMTLGCTTGTFKWNVKSPEYCSASPSRHRESSF